MISKILAAAAALAISGSVFANSPDLALGQPTSASSFYDQGTEVFPSGNVVDGITTDTGTPGNWSFWLAAQGQGAGSWVQVDLGSDFDISNVTLFDTHNRGYDDRGTDAFTISVSTDGVTFQNVATGAFTSDQWLNQTANSVDLSSVTGRYVRFTADSIYGGQSAGLAELEVFGTAAAAVPEPGSSSLALAGLALVGLLGIRSRKSGSAR